MDGNLTIQTLEDCLKELDNELHLTRIYPDGKRYVDIPGLYYASDKFWEDVDRQMSEYVRKLYD